MHVKKIIGISLSVFFLGGIVQASQSEAQAKEKPNILFFLVDDMGLMDTSVPFIFNAEGKPQPQRLNKWFRTPNMARLADQGVRMTEFYAQSLCSPSRVSIMLGQNSARHRTTNWISPYGNNRNAFGPRDWNWAGIKKDDPTLPSLLKKAGYKTIQVGKAHFGPFRHAGANPLNLGFDVCIGGSAIGHPGSYYAKRHYGAGGTNPVPHLNKYWDSDTFLTEALTLEALATIDKSIDKQEPFFLYLGHYAVHQPFQHDPRFIKNYARAKVSNNSKAFATLIEGMDKSLGDVMDHLVKKGVAENTLIIFMGDNGSDSPFGDADNIGSSAPLRGKKGSMWEGGVRVPFIAAWAKPDPNNRFQKKFPILKGGVNPSWGTCYDIYPTLAAVAGAEIPSSWKVDGVNLMKALGSKEYELPTRSFLSHFPHEHRSNYFSTLREGAWKIIRRYDPRHGGKTQDMLFNIKDDISESTDMAKILPERLALMQKKLEASLKDHRALLPRSAK